MLAVCALSTGFSPLLVSAQAKPRQTLEIWPGQRVLLVLPLSVGPDWNAGPELAEAIQPVVRPQLQQAFADTGKFSVTVPYRFDPIFRRAVAEKKINEDIMKALIDTPSLETAQPVLSQLTFDQPPMVAEVQLQELRVGGTQKDPTVQLQVSGKLYEVGGSGPFRNVVVTSRAFGGRTPEARLQAAAADAFHDIAAQFIAPPETFQLPLPAGGASAMAGGKNSGVGSTNANPTTPAPNSGTAGTSNSMPNTMPSSGGRLVIPQLPPAEPPLGIAVPQEPTLAQ